MRRTNVIELQPNKLQKKILHELMLLSSCVYNSTNYVVRQQVFNAEKISSFIDLRKELQTTNDYKYVKDRTFKCSSCGYIADRDLNGARNILTKGMYGSLESIHWNEIVPLEVSV